MTSRRKFLKRTAVTGIAMAMPELAIAAYDTELAGSVGSRRYIAQTVLGPLDASKLGFTLTHEHIADGPEFLNKWPKAWGGKAEFVTKAVERLKGIRSAGISSVVDLTTYDVGRDIRFLENVSRRSGLNIIASTGQRFFPPISDVAMPSHSIEGLAEFFVKEIEQGIDGTDIKAGVIKIGIVSGDVTALEEHGLRAAARASKTTGAPIRIHTDAAKRAGERHAVILEDEGINPAKVSFDHSDDSGDMDYFLGLARRGYSLGMDHVHRGLIPDLKPSFQRRLNCIKLLIDAGFVGKIFLSTDTELGDALLPARARSWRYKLDPPGGMLFLIRKTIPQLEAIGISHRDIQTIVVDHPRSFFAMT